MPRVAAEGTSRFPMQIPPAEKARLMRAAALERTSLKDFVLRNALIAAEAELPADVTLDRLSRRRSLLEQIESGEDFFGAAEAVATGTPAQTFPKNAVPQIPYDVQSPVNPWQILNIQCVNATQDATGFLYVAPHSSRTLDVRVATAGAAALPVNIQLDCYAPEVQPPTGGGDS